MLSILDNPSVNPYRPRVLEFPGLIFPWVEPEVEAQTLLEKTSKYKSLFLEIGSGSGGHLISLAQANPDFAVIGVELRYKRAVRTVEKAIKSNLSNLFVIRADVHHVFPIFADNSVAAVFVNFPDPWEERKRWKHRTMSLTLLDFCKRVLMEIGTLAIKTDHQAYFDAFLADIHSHQIFKILELSRDLHHSEFSAGNILTEFERLFQSQGLPIHYAKIGRDAEIYKK